MLEALLLCKIHFRVPYFTKIVSAFSNDRQKYLKQFTHTWIQNSTRYLPSKCYTNQVKWFKIITNCKYTNTTEFQMNYLNDIIPNVGKFMNHIYDGSLLYMTTNIHNIPLWMCREFAEWATLIQQINKPTESGNWQWSNKIMMLYNVLLLMVN